MLNSNLMNDIQIANIVFEWLYYINLNNKHRRLQLIKPLVRNMVLLFTSNLQDTQIYIYKFDTVLRKYAAHIYNVYTIQ